MIERKWLVALAASLAVNVTAIMLAGTSCLSVTNQLHNKVINVDFSLEEDRVELQLPEQSFQVADTMATRFAQARQNTIASATATGVEAPAQINELSSNALVKTQETVVAQPVQAAQISSTLRSSGYRPPKIISKTEPSYPEISRKQGLCGTVRIKILVRADGIVAEHSVVSSSGVLELDNAALAAVEQWLFHPAIDSATGQAIDAYISFPISFRIH